MKNLLMIAGFFLLERMGDAWLTPWLHKLSLDQAGTGLEALASQVIYYVTYPIEVSALSVVLTLAAALVLLKISKNITHKEETHLGPSAPPAPTEADINNYMALADEADIVEVTQADGTVIRTTFSFPDGFSVEERRLMRVMAQTNTRPLPLRLVEMVFSGNQVAMRVTVQSLINKRLIKVEQEHAFLTASGLQWAHQELSRGLGKPKEMQVQFAEEQQSPLTDDQNLVLGALVNQGGGATLEDIAEFTKWGAVRVRHTVDLLVDLGMVETSRTVRNETVVQLTKLGRQYVVDKGFDLA